MPDFFDGDCDAGSVVAGPGVARRRRGARAYLFGQAAENQVVREYIRRGADVQRRRWRGKAGEIDLILRDGPVLVFVEVKASRDLDTAISHLRPAQMKRIHKAAEEYLIHEPDGGLTDLRFDLACCDQTGRILILENAFGHF